MGYSQQRKKRHQITFRISKRAEELLERKAALFNLKPNMYVKAVIYADIGAWGELLDGRRRPPGTQWPAEFPKD